MYTGAVRYVRWDSYGVREYVRSIKGIRSKMTSTGKSVLSLSELIAAMRDDGSSVELACQSPPYGRYSLKCGTDSLG